MNKGNARRSAMCLAMSPWIAWSESKCACGQNTNTAERMMTRRAATVRTVRHSRELEEAVARQSRMRAGIICYPARLAGEAQRPPGLRSTGMGRIAHARGEAALRVDDPPLRSRAL